MTEEKITIELDGGKYTLIHDPSGKGEKRTFCLRHGEKWRTFLGDKLMFNLICYVEQLRATIEQIHAKYTCMCGDEVNAHNIGSGHSPVSMYDYSLDQEREKVKELERANDQLSARCDEADDLEGEIEGLTRRCLSWEGRYKAARNKRELLGNLLRIEREKHKTTLTNLKSVAGTLREVDQHQKAKVTALRSALKDLFRAFIDRHGCFPLDMDSPRQRYWNRVMKNAKDLLDSGAELPIPMILHCPSCGRQHIDGPNEDKGWANPPHRSHECQSCGHTWRPADVPTTGVAEIRTRGKKDSLPYSPARPVSTGLAPAGPYGETLHDIVVPEDISREPLDYWDNKTKVDLRGLLKRQPQQHTEDGRFQGRVAPWMQACFGSEISNDITERNHRFLEEALELVQACGATADECHQLVDYTFGRPKGEPSQEAGGVMVTLAGLCLANSLNMHEAGEAELERIWGCIEKIRAKQAAKPKGSPLPQHPSPRRRGGE